MSIVRQWLNILLYNQICIINIFTFYCSNDFPLRPLPENDDHPFLLLAQWAPKGHSLIMVQDYDIYYRKTPTSHTGYRITHTAVPGVVSHGVPDWLYEGKYYNKEHDNFDKFLWLENSTQ